MKIFYTLILSILLSSCGTSYYTFSAPENEVIGTNTLKEFLNQNKNPKVVLRTETGNDKITTNQNQNDYYRGIEQQLLKRGFLVRDRVLFERMIGNNEQTINYNDLADKTDTDLIIELTNIDTSVKYVTNEIFNDNGKKQLLNWNIVDYGGQVEFRIILIRKNEFAGSFTFNYAPCKEGCIYQKGVDQTLPKRPNYGSLEKVEKVEKDLFVEFLKLATDKLIDEMLK